MNRGVEAPPRRIRTRACETAHAQAGRVFSSKAVSVQRRRTAFHLEKLRRSLTGAGIVSAVWVLRAAHPAHKKPQRNQAVEAFRCRTRPRPSARCRYCVVNSTISTASSKDTYASSPSGYDGFAISHVGRKAKRFTRMRHTITDSDLFGICQSGEKGSILRSIRTLANGMQRQCVEPELH
jgi:hypothetical protein